MIALLISTIASFILVRRLSPNDYAIYQTITKRAVFFGSILLTLMGDWAYRYNAQKIPGSWEAGIALSLLSALFSALVGLIVAAYLGVGGYLLLVASITVAMMSMYNAIRILMNALRPIRYAALTLIYRTIYTGMIVALVYLAHGGLLGALLSAIFASTISAFSGYSWTRKAKPSPNSWRRILREWFRYGYVYVPSVITVILASLDAIIADRIWGKEVVAAFFATLIVFSLLREAIMQGFGYISTYLLRGGIVENTLGAMRFSLFAITPLLVFAFAHPDHIIFLINPRYSWATSAVRYQAIAALMVLYESFLGSIVSGLARGDAENARNKVLKISLLVLFSRSIYIVLMMVLLIASSSKAAAVNAWVFSSIIAPLITSIGFLVHFKPLSREDIAFVTLPVIVYIALSYIVAYFIPVPLPSHRFFVELKVIGKPFIVYTFIAYTLCILADPYIRSKLSRNVLTKILGSR
ncbi:hypothetical protein PYJP_19060 [Pyrofollis japonicus]|uniref:hypothetical protein n=1 Tax=Pyrofollis japonicus TaxID=3060460 RepID=UPI00295AE134|nr:hypothetical protein [Pyrofollis japonicus]BEP18554.1 hypothetical protein PYJP_19060 [Pyrofollis japonicus]